MGQAVEVIALAAVLGLAIGAAVNLDAGPHDATGHVKQRDAVHDELREVMAATDTWCCPRDPSAASRLQDASLEAWIGDTEHLEELLAPWYTEDPVRHVRLESAWKAHDDERLMHVTTYEDRSPDGETVGVQRWTPIPERGPAHVVPRLEKTTEETGLDVHYVPISALWPYQEGPLGEHDTWIDTSVQYLKSATGDDVDLELSRHAHTELAGAPRPAISVHFKEPPWERINNPLVGLGDVGREYRQVLTKEDLTKERTEFGDGLDDGVYPQHRFRVNVSLHGPGAVDHASGDADEEPGDTLVVEDAYRITAYIPPGWRDVKFTQKDLNDTDAEGWTYQTATSLPGGGHEVTAKLDVNATYKIAYADEAGNPPRVILEDGEEIERTFFFHARPPPDGEHAEMGFHEVTATLESTTFPHHETDRLVVEIPTEVGRVHRSVLTHTPTLVPAAAADNGTELRMTLGATLLNGGETTEVKKVLWTGPEGVFQAGPRDNDDVRTTVGDLLEDSSNWEVRENGSVLAWTGGGECTQLDGCSVAANVTINGSRAPAASPWRPTTLHTLYEERHVQPYLDWFVRSKRAWRGVPADGGAHAGFALGSEARLANPGAAEGAFLWRIPPSSSPMCTDDERAARSQPDAGREGDRRVYDFGPREDGLPVVGDRVDVEDTCTLEEGFEPRIPLIAKSHDRWTEDAIGRSSYQAVDGIPQDILTDWQNGVAESSVTVDEEAVEAGDTVDATVKLESLFDRLADQGLSEATVEARMLDPYNTWQDRAWWNETLLSKGSIDPTTDLAEADCTVATPVSGPDASSCEYDPMGLSDPVSDGDTAANEIDLDVELPDRVVPGTHLLVVDVSWNYTGIEETGHLIEPVDVLLPGGHRGSATLTEGVAWLEDWR